MKKEESDIGLIGLGVMGRHLVLNVLDHGYGVCGFDKNGDARDALSEAARGHDVVVADDIPRLVKGLKSPRAVILLVPAGKAVDSVIDDLTPHLKPDDVIIDAGNSHFTETNRRAKNLDGDGIHLIGTGVSGGAYGARHGPSIMPGGPKQAYERVWGILQDVAAKVDGDPCVAWLGPGSAGHYVKMVHNGIEYGLMQLIAETYDLMHRGLGLTAAELHEVYSQWNEGELEGFLVSATAEIFSRTDQKTGQPLVELILDEASQKGTGAWTSQDALSLQVPIPTIDTAVTMRNLSTAKQSREKAAHALNGHKKRRKADRARIVRQLERGLYAASVLTYGQGLALLRRASQEYDYGLDLAVVARIWRGGCIIRAGLLEKIRHAYTRRSDLENLILDADMAEEIVEHDADLSESVRTAVRLGIPVPGLASSLAYLDSSRSARLPANLIQAQRDYFGSHTYQRIDVAGRFHTDWRAES